MTDLWYLSRDNQQFGPYTWHQIVDLYQSGNIHSKDMLWHPYTQQWVLSKTINFTNDPPIQMHHQAPDHRKKIVYIALGGSLVVLLCVGIFISWFFQSKSTYLSGKGGTHGSINDKVATSDPDNELLQILAQTEKNIHEENYLDWKNYKDLKQEQEAIEKTLNSFTGALKQKDTNGAIAFVQEDRKESYRELFNTRPEAMESFADIISKAEMSFLSAHSPNEPKNRTAEYKVILDDFTFYVIFMKIDDEWVLYDF